MYTSSSANFLIHEAEDDYHAKRATHLTSHQLADFRKCPLLYWRKKQGLIADEDRPAYLVGRALHAFALEGREVYEQRYAHGGPVNPNTGKAYGSATKAFAEWAAQQDKQILTSEQSDLIEKMAASVRNHEVVMALLADGQAEGVVRTSYRGFPCQIRMDWFNPIRNAIIDLKSTDDLAYFEADSRRYGYPWQLAFYRAVFAVAAGCKCADINCYFIGVEKKEPYRAGVWRVADDVLAICQADNEQAMDRLRECDRTGVWRTGYEDIRSLEVI